MELLQIILILSAGHILGDVVFQSSWQALNKKESWYAALTHGAGYGVAMWLVITITSSPTIAAQAYAIFGISIQHMITDKYKINKGLDFTLHVIQAIPLGVLLWLN